MLGALLYGVSAAAITAHLGGGVDPGEYVPLPTPYAPYPNTETVFTNPGLETGAATPWVYLAGDNTSQTPASVTTLGGRSPNSGSRFLNTNSRTTTATNAQSYIGWTQNLATTVLADVDAGIVQAVFSAYRITGTTDTNDRGTMYLLALDASNNILSMRHGSATNPAAWTLEDVEMPLPPGTRKLRFGIHTERYGSGSTEVYADDFALELVSEGSAKVLWEPATTSDWTQFHVGSDAIFDQGGNPAYSHSGRGIFRFGNTSSGGTERRWGREGTFSGAELAAVAAGLVDYNMHGAIQTRHASNSAMFGVRFYDASDTEVLAHFTNSGTPAQYADVGRPPMELTGTVPTSAVKWRAEIQTTPAGTVTQGDTPLFFNLQLSISSDTADLHDAGFTPTWQPLFPSGSDLSSGGGWSESAGWSNDTIREIRTPALVEDVAPGKVRVTFVAGASGLEIGNCFLGRGIASGSLYQFQEAPVRITFNGGNNGFTIGADATIVSDEIDISGYDFTGTSCVVSYDVLSTDSILLRTLANHSFWYKAGVTDVGTTAPTGFNFIGLTGPCRLVEWIYD